MLQLWRTLVLPLSAPTAAVDGGAPVYAALRPLVGGPKFLPLHVQLAHEGVLYDFLPANPSALETTSTLLLGGSVDGRIRCRPVRSIGRGDPWKLIGYTMRESSELEAFALGQESRLSLTANSWCVSLVYRSPLCPTCSVPASRLTLTPDPLVHTQLDICLQPCALCSRRDLASAADASTPVATSL